VIAGASGCLGEFRKLAQLLARTFERTSR